MQSISKNCVIYTRKSTDEGLDQDFNSLDAQREACEAYIISQKAEGWICSKTQYNDGGFSGGTLERPALQELIQDIKDGKVDIILVYKIDRLTRSLADFSKLVEIFDEYNVTFVSITQSFNTTTSMGRLTLNVLLSFAQFEREVTAERIRDKIKASKQKGMWMGGTPPIGYRCENRKLEIEAQETQLVGFIFEQYLKLSTVKQLKKMLDKRGVTTPKRTTKNGKHYGGKAFSRGNLYKILKNPVYIGKIKHKEKEYSGQHEAIINEDIFNTVQRQLKENCETKNAHIIKSGSLLLGLLYDCDGTPYSPTYTSKKGKRYHYYVSQNLLQYKDHPKGTMKRLPAYQVEKTIIETLEKWICDEKELAQVGIQSQSDIVWLAHNPLILSEEITRSITEKIIVKPNILSLSINQTSFDKVISSHIGHDVKRISKAPISLEIVFKVKIANNGAKIIGAANSRAQDPLTMPADQLKRLIKGILWRREHFDGATLKSIAQREQHGENYINRCIQESLKITTL